MRRIDLLISESRAETDNVTYSDTSGISQDQFLRWANSGQTRILSLINQTFPHAFLNESTIDVVSGQGEYDIPTDAFLGSRMVLVEFKNSGVTDQFYYKLVSGRPVERVNGLNGMPVFYIRKDNKILLQPVPDRPGTLRILRQRVMPKLDIRRAVVSSVVLDTVNRTITSLVLDTTLEIDAEKLKAEGYMCVVDKDGNQQMAGIPIDDVNDSTGVVTVSAGFVYKSGESITAGQYVVSGINSTTNSELNDVAERYLVEFMNWKAQKRDSSEDSGEASAEMKDIENDIVQSYSEADADVVYPPILDASYFGSEWRRY